MKMSEVAAAAEELGEAGVSISRQIKKLYSPQIPWGPQVHDYQVCFALPLAPPPPSVLLAAAGAEGAGEDGVFISRQTKKKKVAFLSCRDLTY